MDVDDLYALPLDRFVPERGTLAKALRADRRRDEAKDVAALRKPSVAAWAINQLVRTQGDAVHELVAAGDALRGAHADLVGGHGEEAERRERAEAERAEGERAQALEAARAAGATARRRDERAARALRAAEERRDKAEQALRDADAQLDVARKEADDAAGEHRRARDELDRARETLG